MFRTGGPSFLELAQQALSSTQRGYDLLAPKFEFTPYRTPDEVLGPALALAGGAESIDSAIDLCCGTGASFRHLRPMCRRTLVGLDFSAGMLREARDRGEAAPGTAAVRLVRADVLAPPFRDRFELATCFGALGHIPASDERPFVCRVREVLRPGGRFLFVTSPCPPVTSTRYWLARGFNAAMRVRNAVLKPPFIMYYLTFLLPAVKALLESEGFSVSVREAAFPDAYRDFRVVIATRL